MKAKDILRMILDIALLAVAVDVAFKVIKYVLKLIIAGTSNLISAFLWIGLIIIAVLVVLVTIKELIQRLVK